MSRKSVGNRHEQLAKAWLESQGFTVHRAQSQGVKVGNFFVSRSNDLWHCVDLACIKWGERPLFVQVTSASVGIGVKKAKMDAVPFDPQYCNVQIWFYHGGRHTEKTPGQYFQVRKLDENYELKPENRIFLSKDFRDNH